MPTALPAPAEPWALAGTGSGPGPSSSRDSVQAVLGDARGCGIAEAAPFVRSLRSVYAGRIVLLVDRRPTLLAWLRTHGVQTVLTRPDGVRRRSHPVTGRFAAFARILHSQPDIGTVVAAPVRDVVFQSDPFGPDTRSLCLYPDAGREETVYRVFGAMPRRRGDGGPTLRQSRRACAAIALMAGPAPAVARFCQSAVLLRSIPALGLVRTPGSDREAVTVVEGLGLTGGEVRPGGGRVTTLSRSPSFRVGLRWGLILNPDLSASPIVQGWDRIGRVRDHVRARWGLPGSGIGWALTQFLCRLAARLRQAADARTRMPLPGRVSGGRAGGSSRPGAAAIPTRSQVTGV